MYTKIDINELSKKVDLCLIRLNDNDNFLVDYLKLPFWKRWFFGKRIILTYLMKK